jgi:hypothetical protein
MNITNPIAKAIALVLVSICGTLLMVHSEAATLAKLDSMSATDYVQLQRNLHHHSFGFHFFTILMIGGFFIGIIEFIAYVIGLCFKKPTP